MARRRTGISYAVLAAILFGVSTPFSKLLLSGVPPALLAGLLYLGSGTGLGALQFLRPRRSDEARLTGKEAPWLAGAVLFGGVLGPLLLMIGLQTTPATSASLMLNLEGVFTALLAWFAFHENFDRRIAVGMAMIVSGGLLLSWPAGGSIALPGGSLAIAAACLCWGIDNNLTQKVSSADPVQAAAIKGAAAGIVNTAIGLAAGAPIPGAAATTGALAVGFLGYGLSLTLFVLALRELGAARTGAYFSTAPFIGAIVAMILLREPASAILGVASAVMGIGVWLHVTERHEHEHTHEWLEHSHRHIHDEHHLHEHGPDDPPGEPHTHTHVHEPLTHSHPHYPDIHHRHKHG